MLMAPLTAKHHSTREAHARALCNGKTLAFQARDAGSIPAARSSFPRTATFRRFGLPAPDAAGMCPQTPRD